MGGCWAYRANDHRHLLPAQGTTRFEDSDLHDALTSLHHGQEEEQAGEHFNYACARSTEEAFCFQHAHRQEWNTR